MKLLHYLALTSMLYLPAAVSAAPPDQGPTQAPMQAPKAAPMQAPTQAPMEAPKAAPMQAPTQAPMKGPMQAPTQAPMQAPKAAPAPMQAPTQAPLKGPMQAPTQAPTQAPFKSAQVDQGYRSYSFEPGPAPYASENFGGDYGGGYLYRDYGRRTGRSFENVSNKMMGRVD